MSNNLDINRIVEVNISVSPLALQTAGFGVLNIIGASNVIPFSERLRAYNTIDGVSDDFGTSAEEYKAAAVFFSQAPKPSELYISRRADADKPAQLLCGSNPTTTIATWAAITNGGFKISVDTVEEAVASLNFSAATTMAAVAAIISTGFVGGTCTWDAANTRFILTGTTVGTGKALSFLTAPSSGTNIAGLMDGLSTDGGTLIGGLDEETITESLTAIEAINSTWYGFAFTEEVDDEGADIVEAAVWAEARTKVFCNTSNDGNTKTSGSTSTIAYTLSNTEYSRTFTVYNEGDYAAVSMFARGATVDFNGDNTTITYMFKKLPTITPSEISASQANAIEAVNCNYYARFGTKLSGDSVSMLANGVMSDGRFLDEIVGIDWLQNLVQTNVFNALYQSTTKIPQTNEGAAILAAVVEEGLQQAVRNGLAAPGEVTTDEGTVYLEKGYEVFVGNIDDQSQSDREARKAPPISFILKGAGAIHGVVISGTFNR